MFRYEKLIYDTSIFYKYTGNWCITKIEFASGIFIVTRANIKTFPVASPSAVEALQLYNQVQQERCVAAVALANKATQSSAVIHHLRIEMRSDRVAPFGINVSKLMNVEALFSRCQATNSPDGHESICRFCQVENSDNWTATGQNNASF